MAVVRTAPGRRTPGIVSSGCRPGNRPHCGCVSDTLTESGEAGRQVGNHPAPRGVPKMRRQADPEQTEKGERVTEERKIVNQAIHHMTQRDGKYLTFSLGGEDYGIGILKIKEIIGMIKITPMPQTPDYVKGVINLRGKVIPVVDLRLRFSMPPMEYAERTCIIVVEIETGRKTVVIGIVVDSVSEVLSIRAEDIADTPTFGTGLRTDFILGMAKMGGGVKILLDIDKVLTSEEIISLDAAAS